MVLKSSLGVFWSQFWPITVNVDVNPQVKRSEDLRRQNELLGESTDVNVNDRHRNAWEGCFPISFKSSHNCENLWSFVLILAALKVSSFSCQFSRIGWNGVGLSRLQISSSACPHLARERNREIIGLNVTRTNAKRPLFKIEKWN